MALALAAAIIAGCTDGEDPAQARARARLGPIDEVVTLAVPVAELDQRLARLADRLVHQPAPGTDGLLVARSVDARVAGRPDCLLEVTAAEARRFGPHADATGFTGIRHGPRPGEVFVHSALADRAGLAAGDRVELAVGAARRDVSVARVVDRIGVAGYCGVLVPPGTVVDLAEVAETEGEDGFVQPRGLVFVSNDGGVVAGATGSAAVGDWLRGVVGDEAGVTVATPKADLLGRPG